jgi:hypothetical protein
VDCPGPWDNTGGGDITINGDTHISGTLTLDGAAIFICRGNAEIRITTTASTGAFTVDGYYHGFNISIDNVAAAMGIGGELRLSGTLNIVNAAGFTCAQEATIGAEIDVTNCTNAYFDLSLKVNHRIHVVNSTIWVSNCFIAGQTGGVAGLDADATSVFVCWGNLQIGVNSAGLHWSIINAGSMTIYGSLECGGVNNQAAATFLVYGSAKIEYNLQNDSGTFTVLLDCEVGHDLIQANVAGTISVGPLRVQRNFTVPGLGTLNCNGGISVVGAVVNTGTVVNTAYHYP